MDNYPHTGTGMAVLPDANIGGGGTAYWGLDGGAGGGSLSRIIFFK